MARGAAIQALSSDLVVMRFLRPPLQVCFFVALYYNVIISWSFFYFSQSFQQPLPWHECPLVKNKNFTCEPSAARG